MNRYQVSKVNGLSVKKPFITFVADYFEAEYGFYRFFANKKNWYGGATKPELLGSFYYSGDYLVEKL